MGFLNHTRLYQKCHGNALALYPNDQSKINELNKDPNLARAAAYGAETIDEIIKEVKPDIYIGAEDIWAFNEYWNRKWWNKNKLHDLDYFRF